MSNWVPTIAGFGQTSEVDAGVLGADVGWPDAARGIVVCVVVWQLGAWREGVADVECRMMKKFLLIRSVWVLREMGCDDGMRVRWWITW